MHPQVTAEQNPVRSRLCFNGKATATNRSIDKAIKLNKLAVPDINIVRCSNSDIISLSLKYSRISDTTPIGIVTTPNNKSLNAKLNKK